MAVRSRLGRGLGSLLSMTEPANEADSNPKNRSSPDTGSSLEQTLGATPTVVPIETIDVNPHQPRREFDEAALTSLADSIRANGIIQPIVVRPLPTGRYELIAGERRLRAAKLAKHSEMPIVVREVDAYTQAQWALVENIHREDLNPIDRAEAYASLMQQLGLTQAELSGRLGEQRSSVANHLRLLELASEVREDVRSGTLTLGHAKVLAGVESPAEQLRLAALTKSQNLSVRNLERLIEQQHAAPTAVTATAPLPVGQRHLDEVEGQIVQQLGLRVQLKSGKKSGTGRVVIHYQSLEQFDELMKRCGVHLNDA